MLQAVAKGLNTSFSLPLVVRNDEYHCIFAIEHVFGGPPAVVRFLASVLYFDELDLVIAIISFLASFVDFIFTLTTTTRSSSITTTAWR